MQNSKEELRVLHDMISAISSTIATHPVHVEGEIADDYNGLVRRVGEIIDRDMTPFRVPPSAYTEDYRGRMRCNITMFKNKVAQALAFLKNLSSPDEHIIQIGTLYNSIQDEELKARCADLLTATDKFDRAIGQATLVLEDRIRTRLEAGSDLFGVNLVNAAFVPKPGRTILRVSTDDNEQRGFCEICRGIVAAFRNPTHHQLVDTYSREEALKVCAFVDNLLRTIDNAQKV